MSKAYTVTIDLPEDDAAFVDALLEQIPIILVHSLQL